MPTRLTKSIRVSEEVYETLSRKGNVMDSFDDVISRLLKKEKPNFGHRTPKE